MIQRETPVSRGIGPAQNGVQMTPAEFDAIEEYDELSTLELIEGVLVVNPIPSERERGPVLLLAHLLFAYQENSPGASPLDAVLFEQYVYARHSRRRADLVLWTGLGRMPNPKRDVPSIVVEFLSAGRRNFVRDFFEKRGEYLALGVREYWIFDRFAREMTVFTKGPSGPEEHVFPEGELYQTPLLPGFELPIARLFAAADAWGRGDDAP